MQYLTCFLSAFYENYVMSLGSLDQGRYMFHCLTRYYTLIPVLDFKTNAIQGWWCKFSKLYSTRQVSAPHVSENVFELQID